MAGSAARPNEYYFGATGGVTEVAPVTDGQLSTVSYTPSLGLMQTQIIGKIRVDPANCDAVYVAALGHAFGPNNQRVCTGSSNGGTGGSGCCSATTRPARSTW